MQILHIACEGYGNLDELFSYGENYYLVDDKDLPEIEARFNDWQNSLGPCPDAIGDNHSLSTHVYMNVLELSELPKFLRLP